MSTQAKKKVFSATKQRDLVEDITIEQLLAEEMEQDTSADSQAVKEEDSQVDSQVVAEEDSQMDSQAVTEQDSQDSEVVAEADSQMDSETVTEEDSQADSEVVTEEDSQEDSEVVMEEDSQEDSEVVTENDSQMDSEVVTEEDSQDSEVVAEEDSEESYDFTADVKALESASSGLSEDFKNKAATIFEAAVTSKIREEKKKIEKQNQVRLEAAAGNIQAALVEKIDQYLSYVVENWMKENEVAIEHGLRTEIAEDFIGSLKTLFTEKYIEVPESKRDLYVESEKTVSSLKEQVAATEKANATLAKELKSFQRKAIVTEASEGLTATQIEKLNSLVEEVEFSSAEAFKVKVKTIKESYFSKKAPAKTSSPDFMIEGEQKKQVERLDPSMQKYIAALERSN